MKILLIFLPILALPLTRLSAIGINLDQIQFGIGFVSLNVSPPFSHIQVGNLDVPPENPNYEFTWNFANSEESATFAGTTYIRGSLRTIAKFAFTLSETVDFLLSGGVRHSEGLPSAFTSLDAVLGPYQIGSSVLDIISVGTLPTSLSGTLAPGNYLFTTNVFSHDAESTSHAELKLTPVSVPDGGSTLLMLGMAICAIGGIFRKVNRA